MAETYRTEEEQIEALKKWWQENGKSTVAGVVVAIAAVLGWQGWQQQQQSNIDAASALYQDMLIAANNDAASAEQLATAKHLANSLKQDYSNSTYARFAALYKAKLAVDDNDLASAEQELRWVLAEAAMPELILETRLRLARVLYAQDQFDEALAQLQGDSAGFAAAYEETRGDIYLAQGDSEQALLAYQKASELNRQAQQPLANPMLELKMTQLQSARAQGETAAAVETAVSAGATATAETAATTEAAETADTAEAAETTETAETVDTTAVDSEGA